MRKRVSRWVIASAALLGAAVMLYLICASFEAYALPIRAAGRAVSSLFGIVFSAVPIPLSEILIIGVILLVPALLISFPVRYGARRGFAKAGCRLLFTMSLAVFMFTANWGVQYSAPPLADRLGMYIGRYTAQQLRDVCALLAAKANEYSSAVPRDSSGNCAFGDFGGMSRSVRGTYRTMAGDTSAAFDYSVFAGAAAPAKKGALLSVPMSYLDVAGYFFPWTGEAVVSGDYVDSHYPFCIAHETAHALGVTAEDEANFAAFLACVHSDDPRALYSGYLCAFVYASNSLYAADYDSWLDIFTSCGEPVLHDLDVLAAHLAKYDTPVRDVGTAVNDTYIKATGQPGGVMTYGKVTDLLLAYYIEE